MVLQMNIHQNQSIGVECRLTTIGEACRAVKAETLERVIDWIVEKLTVEHWSVPEIKAVLAQS